jgi:hypothetical protein
VRQLASGAGGQTAPPGGLSRSAADHWATIQREMGVSSEQAPIFVKQYGEYRTGANALRALLLENFDNAVVLMHVLGDKHSRPADFGSLARGLAEPGADAHRIILEAARSRPGGFSLAENFYQIFFVRAVAGPVAAALADGSLRVAVSVRHPYPWLEAVLRFWNWPAQDHPDAWVRSEATGFARRLCERFNGHYAAWLAVAANPATRAIEVRAEDLIECPERVTTCAANCLGLHARRNSFARLRGSVLPSPWDHFPPCYERRRRHARPRELAPSLREIAEELIEWTALAALGYYPSGQLVAPAAGRPA